MKAESAPRVSVIDALGAGLNLAARRPALLTIPVVIDLGLWLAPRLSVQTLLQRFAAIWEALLTTIYTSAQRTAMAETIAVARNAFDALGRSTDLATAITVGWLAPPSAVVDVQATRLKLVSDAVLAPVGLGLTLPQVAEPSWQTATVDVANVWLALLVVVAFWAVGQVLTAFYMRSVAAALVAESTVSALRSGAAPASRTPRSVPPANGVPQTVEPANARADAGSQGGGGARLLPLAFGKLLLRFAVLGLLLGIVVFLMRVPLALAMALAVVSGSALTAGIFVFSGGLTLWFMLWFLSAGFFASEAILFEGQPLGRALWQAFILARSSGWRTFGLIVLVNLIALGFRAVWGLLGQTPIGVLLSILGNAYLVTGLLLAIYIYYNGLRRELQVLRTGRRVIK